MTTAQKIKSFTEKIPTADGVCDAFIAHPDDGKKHPGVILYMDAFGVRPYLCQMAERLAAHGYYVVTPNLFYRTRPAPVFDLSFPLTMEDMPQARSQIMAEHAKFKVEDGVADAGALLQFLSRQALAREGKYGVVGYCMGGGLALRVAIQYPNQIGAVAGFHAGRLATEAEDSPHRQVNRVKAALYFAHAENDSSMPQEQIQVFEKALKDAGLSYRSEVYPGAQHGFTMLDLPAGNKEATERHWENLLKLFAVL
jgi:carboxymethylenebutenolidase